MIRRWGLIVISLSTAPASRLSWMDPVPDRAAIGSRPGARKNGMSRGMSSITFCGHWVYNYEITCHFRGNGRLGAWHVRGISHAVPMALCRPMGAPGKKKMGSWLRARRFGRNTCNYLSTKDLQMNNPGNRPEKLSKSGALRLVGSTPPLRLHLHQPHPVGSHIVIAAGPRRPDARCSAE